MNRFSRLAGAPFGVALLALAWVGSGAAQEPGTVTGTVWDLQTGKPISGVTLTIDGSRLKAGTNSEGIYRIEGLPAGEHVMRLRADGYVTVIEKLTIDAGWTTGVDIAMPPLFATLEALEVEVGLGSTRRDSLTGAGRARDVDTDNPFASLSRIPGVHVAWSGGVAGRGARIQIRGATSMTLSNDPAIFVDGIRVMPETPVYDNSGPGATQYYNLDFVEPSSIDRIEVLKGPATAARFGLNASAGVILIYTKRGGG